MKTTWLAALVTLPSLAIGLFSGCGNNVASSLATAAHGASSGAGGATSCTDGLAEAANSEFCAKDPANVDCALVTPAYKDQVCGVPLKPPTKELARSSNVKEFAGSGPPQLDCFDPAHYPPPPGANKGKPVKIQGLVKIFSHGCSSDGVQIEVHTVKRTGPPADDGDLDQPVGTPVTTPTDCKANGVGTMNADCTNETRYECNFTFDGAPEETELVITTSGANWAPLLDYNIYIPDSEVMNGVWQHDVRALAADDYTAIPQVTFGHPVTQGNGVIAGEVHDCGNVRLINAVADVNVGKAVTTYFTANEDHPLPDLSADSTSPLGLYASFDLAPGPVTVAAAGMVGGKLVTVGYFRARVFPDSVTAVTFRGLRPFQLP